MNVVLCNCTIAVTNDPAVVFSGFYPGFCASTLHKFVNFFRPCLFSGQFSSFLVEEDAQKAHVSIVFVHSHGLSCEIVSPHLRRQQIPLISSIPKWMKTGFWNGVL
jgi:hypothetical protein